MVEVDILHVELGGQGLGDVLFIDQLQFDQGLAELSPAFLGIVGGPYPGPPA